MSNYAFSVDDWPLKDENGNLISYKPDVSSPPLQRGVLRASSREAPAVPWYRLVEQFDPNHTRLNFVGFHVPHTIDASGFDKVRDSLRTLFQIAFPFTEEPRIRMNHGNSRGKKGTYVGFDTPSTNVRSGDIVAAAATYEWKADGHLLGKPWYVGIPTNELLLPVQFLGVPEACKERFIDALPEYLTTELDPYEALQIVDIWESQSRRSQESPWTFDGRVLALVAVTDTDPDPSITCVNHIASNWPGWFHFEDECLIKLQYPSRFKFCEFCLHTAQDLSGPNQRHTDKACIKITCGVCGHIGHNSAEGKPDPDGENKKACEQGKKRRNEEREEARKRQRIENEKRAAEEEAARKAAEEEEARKKAEEEGTAKTADDAAGASSADTTPTGAEVEKDVEGNDEDEVQEKGAEGATEAATEKGQDAASKDNAAGPEGEGDDNEAEVKVEESL
ncbi:hypothetical protein PSEUBRA_003396 [Kalmanozyma brasiliensis GHG001]|nr:uncharacterized protein PSEUBRA_003396 [Kalmanozyma brasiliensis GHG001]EST07225.2 hypothetical protein PSEUBRA_003396 [Kalmanozyma brasiliensis GHG001]